MNGSLEASNNDDKIAEKEQRNQTETKLDQDYEEGQHEKQKNDNKKRGRHGARNQHRHKHLVKWIVKTFPDAINIAKDDGTNASLSSGDDEENNSRLVHVLDVAGGKGELASRLTLCHQVRVKMVDPRPADVLDCFHKLVFRSLPKKWQEKIASQDSTILQNAIQRRFQQHVMYFPSDSDASTCISQLNESKELLQAVKDSSLIIGMHADGATESIVDLSMHYRKPFLVIPCCVFPNFFKGRFIPRHRTKPSENTCSGESLSDENEDLVPVRSHEQFCKYLLMKDSHFVMETLPFEGRNIAIWWDGLHLDSDSNCKNDDVIQ